MQYMKFSGTAYSPILNSFSLFSDKQVDKTGLSTVSIGVVFSKDLWPIQSPCQQMPSSTGSHGALRFSYYLLEHD